MTNAPTYLYRLIKAFDMHKNIQSKNILNEADIKIKPLLILAVNKIN